MGVIEEGGVLGGLDLGRLQKVEGQSMETERVSLVHFAIFFHFYNSEFVYSH